MHFAPAEFKYLFKIVYKYIMRVGTNVAIFILFFGITLIEAIQNKDWLLAVFFLLVGLVFLYSDNKK